MNLSKLEVSEVIELIKASDKNLTDKYVYKDIVDGLPRDEDGTISLFKYVAWMLKNGTK